MHLIATDEAGYGPKLGPLTVAATRWHVKTENDPCLGDFQSIFDTIRNGGIVDGTRFVVDDSKAVFKPRSAGAGGGNLNALEIAALIAHFWIGNTDESSMIASLAPDDIDEIRQSDWLRHAESENIEFSSEDVSAMIAQWQKSSVVLCDAKTRIITASNFNDQIASGFNKADILSSTTLQLIKRQLEQLPDDGESVCVFCDRHGGRQYYASILQSIFEGTLVRVISESKTESAYKLNVGGREIAIRFTVKGDRFTPVAYSSMIAKYLREKMMESFNQYFAELHREFRDDDSLLRPTAGYPVDADRFLDDAKELIEHAGIKRNKLIRVR